MAAASIINCHLKYHLQGKISRFFRKDSSSVPTMINIFPLYIFQPETIPQEDLHRQNRHAPPHLLKK